MNTAMEFIHKLENRRRDLNAQLDRVHQNHLLNRRCKRVERAIRVKLDTVTDALFCCSVCPDGRCESCRFKSEVQPLLH